MKKENIIENYIEIIRNEFRAYIEIIYEGKYNKQIFNSLVEKYISERYKEGTIKRKSRLSLNFKIQYELKKTENILKTKYPIQEISSMREIIENCLHFDRIIKITDIPQRIQNISKIRQEKLNINTKNFIKEFELEVKERMKIKQDFLKSFESTVFKLKKVDVDKSKNLSLIQLKNNIKFPSVYSEEIINEVFSSGTTCEDKLVVEYSLISQQVLKNIINEKQKRKYLVEFEPSIFKKKTKLNKTLKIIDSDYLKESVIMLINSNSYSLDMKNEMYPLMRQGFKFAIKLEEKINFEVSEFGLLDVFSYIIVEEKIYSQYKNSLAENGLLRKVIRIK